MKWHKISEELPPENEPILFRKPEDSTCENSYMSDSNYMYHVGTVVREWSEIYSYIIRHQSWIEDWSDWTLIEPPEENNND
jgi:hypothetical protein